MRAMVGMLVWFALHMGCGVLAGAGVAAAGFPTAAGLVAALALAVALWRTASYVRHLGHFRLDPRRWEKGCARVVERVRARRGMVAGVCVLATPDEVWEQVVRRLAAEADAVVLDVTQLTANMETEIAILRERLPPERLVLLCATPRLGSLPGDVERLLEDRLGRDHVRRAKVVTYEVPGPGNARRIPSRRRYRNQVAAALALCLADAVEAARRSA
jgi:hypothetical protein